MLACAAMWVTITGCDDTTGPGPADIAGDYDLVEYENETLPAETGRFTVFDSGSEVTCTIVVRSGSLHFGSNGTYVLSYDRETRCDNGGVSLDGTSEEGSFSVAGDTIQLSFNAFLGGTMRTLVRDGERIRFTEANSNVTRAVFERTSQ
jgi:hypothetical protein